MHIPKSKRVTAAGAKPATPIDPKEAHRALPHRGQEVRYGSSLIYTDSTSSTERARREVKSGLIRWVTEI